MAFCHALISFVFALMYGCVNDPDIAPSVFGEIFDLYRTLGYTAAPSLSGAQSLNLHRFHVCEV
jgi:hypothetical protein